MSSNQPVNSSWYHEPPSWDELLDDEAAAASFHNVASGFEGVPPAQPSKHSHRRLTTIWSIALGVALAAGVGTSSYFAGISQNWQSEAQGWERSAAAADARVTALEGQLANLQADHQLALTGVDAATDQAQRAHGQLDLASGEIADLTREAGNLAEEVAELKRDLATQKTETTKAKNELATLRTNTREQMGQIVSVIGTCVSELTRLENLLANPLQYDPADSDAWIREHRSLCESAVSAGNVLLGTLAD